MSLRMTEEEFTEWQRSRAMVQEQLAAEKRAGASPTCCQPARVSRVSVKETDEDTFAKLRKRVAKYTAAQVMADRGYPGAEIVLPEDRRPKESKYKNKRVQVDGIWFQSIHESQVYLDLMARVKAGELKCVWRQVRFDLGGGPNASHKSRYSYFADFVAVDRENRVEVIDAKSEATRKNRTYINKKKQVLAEWGIEIREV